MQARTDGEKVTRIQFGQVNLGEPVEKGLRQTFTPTALMLWVLRCENTEIGMASEGTRQFWNEDLASVIKDRI